MAIERPGGLVQVTAGQALPHGAAAATAQARVGRFLPDVATVYGQKRWSLDGMRAGDALWTTDARTLLAKWHDVGMDGRPSVGLSMEVRQDQGREIHHLVATSDRTTIWRLLTGPCPLPAFAYRFDLRLVRGAYSLSAGQSMPTEGLPDLPKPATTAAPPVESRWMSFEIRFRRVGWEDDGTPIQETRLMVDGRCHAAGWVRGVPNGFAVTFAQAEIDLSAVTVLRLTE